MDRIAYGDRIPSVGELDCNMNLKEPTALPYREITSPILQCCFDVLNELGSGFLEAVYKNALLIALREKGLIADTEQLFEIYFRGKKIGFYRCDIIVEQLVIVELKSCKCLLAEHQAQVINYLKVAKAPVGLLVNFGNQKLDYKRLYNPLDPAVEVNSVPSAPFCLLL